MSGLNIGAESSSDARVQLLVESLSSEIGNLPLSLPIVSLIIAGNSMASLDSPNGVDSIEEDVDKKQVCQKYILLRLLTNIWML